MIRTRWTGADAVVEAIRPVDGTQDAEAERAAIRDVLSELLTRFPEADLLNLDPNQRGFAIERFTAIDVFRRFELDVGKTIVEKAPSVGFLDGPSGGAFGSPWLFDNRPLGAAVSGGRDATGTAA